MEVCRLGHPLGDGEETTPVVLDSTFVGQELTAHVERFGSRSGFGSLVAEEILPFMLADLPD